ncbi:hypothetical protein ACQKGC_22995 [Allorhizobium pseudoryzae]|uniref:hypothetical protein n=1 Tax=Allorhizobium pseudoryzae TaxID=379684 RepID=UPI003D07C5DF
MIEARRFRPILRLPVIPVLAGAIAWSFATSLIAAVHLAESGRFDSFHLSTILAIFAAGGSLSWLLSVLCLAVLRPALQRSRIALVSVAFLGLGLATITVTAGLFALDYRAFYARWHADAFSRDWFLQQAFTTASALYQFLVIGLRLYLPYGPLALVGATALLLRTTR